MITKIVAIIVTYCVSFIPSDYLTTKSIDQGDKDTTILVDKTRDDINNETK
ncbi:hypothetical protein [Myroides pelagicus]|uniref:Uncharacterized protein n=1 Tax=Myroides pelagicus TaxID=270914 RepID=A0A7K1GK27_9FLAO|nr:hypothetical protein [Myroides pelagicus]MEC4113769.1 hypothetical protein [Myroides pelagicus]MTH28773.1 hypothetical protein [Myroides pelagicus]